MRSGRRLGFDVGQARTGVAVSSHDGIELTNLNVLMIDERLTTSTAQSLLRSAGKNAKNGKSSIDAAAATLILEQALSLERAGNVPGKRIEECK
jgi:RNase H-fold protein (predicted Holliday junction resolvase)